MVRRLTTQEAHLVSIVALALIALLFWKFRIIDPAASAEDLHLNLTNVDFFNYIEPASIGVSRALLEGRVPLWNPFQGGGHPALASIPVGALYPLNLPYLIVASHTAIEVIVVLHLILAGTFMLFYGRSIGLNLLASAAAAGVFMFSGFLVSRAVWFTPALAATVWLPLALLSIEKIFERARASWMICLGIAVAMPILAGWLQLWVYTMYAIGIYAGARFVGELVRGDRSEAPKFAALLVGGIVLGVCLSAVQLLPTYELQGLSPRRTGTLSDAQLNLLNSVTPSVLLAQSTNPAPGQPRMVYLGMGALVLIPLSLFSRRLGLRVGALWFLLLFGLSVAVTNHTPVYALLQKLPTGAWFRAPNRILFLYAFAGAALTGIAVQVLSEGYADRERWRRWGVVVVAAIVASLLSWYVGVSSRGLAIVWAAVALVGCATFPARPQVRSVAAFALVALLVWDLFYATRNEYRHPIHVPELRAKEPEREAFSFIHKHQGLDRTYVQGTSKFDSSVISKQGVLQQINSITDYEPLSLDRRARFFRLFELRDEKSFTLHPFNGWLEADPASPQFQLLDLMSVRYALVHKWKFEFRAALGDLGWRGAFTPRRGNFSVFENPSPLPRAYTVSNAVFAISGEEALKAIAEADFDPRRSLVIEGMPDAEKPTNLRPNVGIRPARIVRYEPEEILIDVKSTREGYLVLTDNFYPGWRASVDGRTVPIRRANYLFRAIALKPGHHQVRFSYRPWSYRLGAGLTLAGLAAIGVYFVRRRWFVGRGGGRAAASAALLLLVGLLSVGCGDEAGDTDAKNAATQAAPVAKGEAKDGTRAATNVIVFVIDTLRSDHLGAYGYERDVSPIIDGVAERGVVFDHVSSVAPRTWQSFTSILTGLYPPRHGVRYVFSPPLDRSIPTLASILASQGYQTAAFDGMTFLRGMTGGGAFEEYVDPKSLSMGSQMLGDDALIDQLIGWLDTAKPPFFAFLRVTAPHWTYICRPVFHAEVEDHDSISHQFNSGTHGMALENGQLALKDLDAYRQRFYDYDPLPAEREHMILHYDECIRESDAAIGRSLDHLAGLGLEQSTIVVITADHGESFGEHGYLQHGPQVDGPVVNVPLIVQFPDSLDADRGGKRVTRLAQTVDIFPTLLDVLEIESPAELDGESLLPVLDAGVDLATTAYAEAGRAFVGVDPEVFLPGIAGKQRMLRDQDWKLLYIPNEAEGIVRLYDLKNDPGETKDVASDNPQVVARLRALLDAAMQEPGEPTPERELSEEEEARLRALGYL